MKVESRVRRLLSWGVHLLTASGAVFAIYALIAIASADLAHMGLQFGDREGINEYSLRILEEEDREMLGYVERVDGEGFFSSISKEGDRRRICGLPAIYAMLKVIDASEGRLLKYGQAFTPETQSVVSFASLTVH